MPIKRVGRQGLVLRLVAALLTLVLATIGSAGMLSDAHATGERPAPMPTPRDGPAAASFGTSIYVFGGRGAETTVEAYDTVTNTWATKAPMPTGRYSLGAAVGSDGKIYVVGGQGGPTVVEAYTPQTDTWEAKPPVPDGGHVEHAVVADAQGRIYAIGGFRTEAMIHRFDPTTGMWTSPTALPTPRLLLEAALAPDGAIYTLGGPGPSLGQAFATVERYDPVANTWTTLAPMPTPRQGLGAAFGPNGRLYAFGGFFTQESPMTLEEYDPATNTWATRRMTTKGVFGHSFVAVNGRLYAMGGLQWMSSLPSPILFVYDPITDTWLPDQDAPTITSVRINQGASFTNSLQVTLSIQATDLGEGVESMSFSDDGSTWSPWQSYASTVPWSMTQRSVNSYRVVARVRDHAGNVSDLAVTNTVMLDQTPPTGSVSISSSMSPGSLQAASPTRSLRLTATDDRSSQAQIQVRLSNRPDFAGAIWKSFASSVSWDFTGGATVYAQFKDGAGNISQTYSQSVGSAPSGGTSPTPNCSPRPRIDVRTEVAVGVPESGGAIKVIVSTTGANNGFRAVRFDSFTNAMVHAGSQTNQTAPFAYSIPPGQEPTSVAFFVQRQTPGQSTTVRLVVIDGCGEWSTLVGGGPNAF